MSEENKLLVRRYYEQVLNQRDLASFDELADPSFVSHLPDGTPVDIDVYKRAIAASLAAFPDLQVIIEDQVAEADRVVTRWRATGTPAVTFAGTPPGVRPVTISAIHIHRLQGGKFVEHWEAINLHAVKPG